MRSGVRISRVARLDTPPALPGSLATHTAAHGSVVRVHEARSVPLRTTSRKYRFPVGGPPQAGGMLWLSRNTLSGSYRSLEFHEPGQLLRTVDRERGRPRVRRSPFLPEEVHVLPAGRVRFHVGGEPTDERGPCGVVGGIGPEPVDVQPVPRRPIRERRRVLRHPTEGALHVMDVERRPTPRLFAPAADDDLDRRVVEPIERRVLPVRADALRKQAVRLRTARRPTSTGSMTSTSGGAAVREARRSGPLALGTIGEAQTNPRSMIGSSPSSNSGGGVMNVAIDVIGSGTVARPRLERRGAPRPSASGRTRTCPRTRPARADTPGT